MSTRRALQELRARFYLFSRIGFLRSVGVLVGGTVIAQVITVLTLPVLTRIYSPDDFSVFAVFTSILSICTAVACLRMEIAVPMPEYDDEAVNLLVISVCSGLLVAALLMFVIWCWPIEITRWIGEPRIQPLLWLIPIGIWFASTYSALQYWNTRKNHFRAISKTRVAQSAACSATQLIFGAVTAFGPVGLVFGQIFGSCVAMISLTRTSLRVNRPPFKSVSAKNMVREFKKFNQFPKYSTPEAFANTAGVYIPIVIIAALAIGPEAGYLALAMRAMAVPLGLIGGAVAQVYVSRAPSEFRAGRLADFTGEVFGGLAKSGVGILMFLGIVSPLLIPALFGAEWRRAGELISWMTPWFVAQFLASPLSMILHVTNSQKAALLLQIFGLAFRIGAVTLVGEIDRKYVVEAYALSSAVFYLIYLIVVLFYAEIKLREFIKILKSSFGAISIWVFLGISLVVVVNYIIL